MPIQTPRFIAKRKTVTHPPESFKLLALSLYYVFRHRRIKLSMKVVEVPDVETSRY